MLKYCHLSLVMMTLVNRIFTCKFSISLLQCQQIITLFVFSAKRQEQIVTTTCQSLLTQSTLITHKYVWKSINIM